MKNTFSSSKRVLILLLFLVVPLASQSDLPPSLAITVPGPEHKVLSKFEGNWRQLITSVGASGEDIFGKGTTNNKLIFYGRYLEMEAQINFEMTSAKTTMIIGYDRIDNQFTLFGIDEMSTRPMNATGKYDKSQSEFTFNATGIDPNTKKKLKFRVVFRFESDDKYIYQMFIHDGKKEKKSIEIINIKIQ